MTARPGKILLTGPPGAGKSTLCKALLGHDRVVAKTQSAEYHGDFLMDLPGEFLTHPHLRRAFLASTQDVRVIVYVQAVDAAPIDVPPGLLQTTPGITLVGVVNKTDLPGADRARPRAFLARAGVPEPYFEISALDPATVRELRAYLQHLTPRTWSRESAL